MYNTIKKAGRRLHTVIIMARKTNGKIVTREIEPYGYNYHKRKLYLVCWDVHKQGIRQFLATNIMMAKETENSFLPRYRIML